MSGISFFRTRISIALEALAYERAQFSESLRDKDRQIRRLEQDVDRLQVRAEAPRTAREIARPLPVKTDVVPVFEPNWNQELEQLHTNPPEEQADGFSN